MPVRKPGKLPWQRAQASYALEYGTDASRCTRTPLGRRRVLVVDDVIATGGTAKAVAALTEALGGRVSGFLFLVELCFLNGREASPATTCAV